MEIIFVFIIQLFLLKLFLQQVGSIFMEILGNYLKAIKICNLVTTPSSRHSMSSFTYHLINIKKPERIKY